MSLSYFNKKIRRQSKSHETNSEPSTEPHDTAVSPPPAPTVASPSEEPAASPLLDEEDERFLQRLAAISQEPEGPPPPLPERPAVVVDDSGEAKVGKDAQEALMAGADKIPLPMSPPEVKAEEGGKGKQKAATDGFNNGLNRSKSTIQSYFTLAQSKFKRTGLKDDSKDKAKAKDEPKEEEKKDKKGKKEKKLTEKQREKAANDLLAAAEISKTTEEEEAEKERQDLTTILDQLNLSAVNNRVFSFSKESEELLNKFKLVLKDIVNGAPEAYNDLEKLLTDSDNQLKKMYDSLPPFLQNLVKSLPAKMTATLGPELLAATSEKPGFDGKQAGAKSKKFKPKIPSLKSLVSAEGAVATMLKSILNFLKLRFPALMTGTNILLSLAVFLLMFVFWYCHKRGRETRLEREGLAAQEGESALASSASSFTENDGDFLLAEASSSKQTTKGKEVPAVTAEDLPSVLHLPDPKTVPLPETPAQEREPPLKVPEK